MTDTDVTTLDSALAVVNRLLGEIDEVRSAPQPNQALVDILADQTLEPLETVVKLAPAGSITFGSAMRSIAIRTE
jgi:hypothetical protein